MTRAHRPQSLAPLAAQGVPGALPARGGATHRAPAPQHDPPRQGPDRAPRGARPPPAPSVVRFEAPTRPRCRRSTTSRCERAREDQAFPSSRGARCDPPVPSLMPLGAAPLSEPELPLSSCKCPSNFSRSRLLMIVPLKSRAGTFLVRVAAHHLSGEDIARAGARRNLGVAARS